MDFGEALKALKNHKHVGRAGWNGRGMYLYLDEGHTTTVSALDLTPTFVREPHIVLYTVQHTHQPGWVASQADILADDWIVIDHYADWSAEDNDDYFSWIVGEELDNNDPRLEKFKQRASTEEIPGTIKI